MIDEIAEIEKITRSYGFIGTKGEDRKRAYGI